MELEDLSLAWPDYCYTAEHCVERIVWIPYVYWLFTRQGWWWGGGWLKKVPNQIYWLDQQPTRAVHSCYVTDMSRHCTALPCPPTWPPSCWPIEGCADPSAHRPAWKNRYVRGTSDLLPPLPLYNGRGSRSEVSGYRLVAYRLLAVVTAAGKLFGMEAGRFVLMSTNLLRAHYFQQIL